MGNYTHPLSRLAALLFDAFAIGVVAVLLGAACLRFGVFTLETPIVLQRVFYTLLAWPLLPGFALALGASAILLQTICAAAYRCTPGLALMGAKITATHGDRAPGLGASFVRTIVLFVIVLVPPLWLTCIMMFWRSDRRGLHDLCAGTAVREEEEYALTLDELSVAGERGLYY